MLNAAAGDGSRNNSIGISTFLIATLIHLACSAPGRPLLRYSPVAVDAAVIVNALDNLAAP